MIGFTLSPTAHAARHMHGASSPSLGPAVFLIAGQSNSVGWSEHDGGSIHPANVCQWSRVGGVSGAGVEEVIPASVAGLRTRLDHDEVGGELWAGLDIALSEALVAAFPGRDIVFVPAGKGGTGLNCGDAEGWGLTETLYADAVARANACLSALPGATFEGIVWHQGERNATVGTAGATYAADLAGVLAGFRSDIAGAAGAPVLVGEMHESFVSLRGANGEAIQDAIRALPAALSNCAAASSQGLAHNGDGTHFSPAAYRTLGARYAALLPIAQADAAAAPDAIDDLVATGGDGQVTLSWSAPTTNGTPVARYIVERSEDQSAWTPLATLDRGVLSYTDLSMTPNVPSHYRVAADSGLGASAWSASASATATLTALVESGASAHWFLPAQSADLVSGQALTTSGTTAGTGYLELLDPADFIRTGRTDTAQVTIACVIRLDPASTSYIQLMGSRASDGGGGETGMGLYVQGANFKGQFADGAEERTIDPATKSAWVFLALSINASDVMTLKRTGGGRDVTYYRAAAGRGTTGAEIVLGPGFHPQPTESGYAAGFRVAEIIVWENQALPDTELQAVAQRSMARCASAGLTVEPGS